ncbi:hypothetical protein QGN23_14330 [Chryseobacterium gotjawalense]|uniref:Uncharacterized protein n=1 Tax=Chryseobacterium gotjawalense TaxID=3042315 RepID=A0ABY8RC81_9FLAO|nr:hypothetical protein [Chryseobacterium sp. wdc7]WHF51581.1 hypothetical protein QGN23_14330 [Chryseobacterium sp. wdc7]
MNPALLRKILIWVSPMIIAFIVKKYEERQLKNQQAKATVKN